jgi:hypothetical protein
VPKSWSTIPREVDDEVDVRAFLLRGVLPFCHLPGGNG